MIGPKYPARLRIVPAHARGRRRRRCAAGDRAVLLRQRADRAPADRRRLLIVAIALVRYLPAGRRARVLACWRSRCGWRCSSAGVHPTLAGVAVALLIPVFTPERQRGRGGRRGRSARSGSRRTPSTRAPRLAACASRSRSTSGCRPRSDPYVSFVILPLFALGQRGCAARPRRRLPAALRSPLTWGIVAGLVVGKFVGITGATAWFSADRNRRARARADAAPHRRRRRAVRHRFHHLAVHRRHRDLRPGDAGPGARRRAGGLGHRVRAGLGDLPGHRLAESARAGRADADSPVDPDRDHIRGRPDAPLTLVEYGDFECPFCSRATGAIDEVRAHFGDELRYVWRHLPLERVHPRAMDAARASEAAALQGKFFEMARATVRAPGRSGVVAHLPVRRRRRLRHQRSSTTICTRRRCCTGCRTTRRTPRLMDLNSTPTFFVNGRRHKGPWDAASLIRALEASRG